MSERLAALTARIASAEQLGTVIAAIRGIAAARAQQGTTQLAAASAYADMVLDAVSAAAGMLSGRDDAARLSLNARRGLLVFGGEQGFAGAFSARMVSAAASEGKGTALLLVGSRGISAAEERRLHVDWGVPMAARIEGIPKLANRIVETIYQRITASKLDAVELLVPHQETGQPARIERVQLYPLPLIPLSSPKGCYPPLLTLSPILLAERLVEEYVYARICAAALQAFTAENLARLETMAGARLHVGRMLEELGRERNQVRQGEITSEIIELASADPAEAP